MTFSLKEAQQALKDGPDNLVINRAFDEAWRFKPPLQNPEASRWFIGHDPSKNPHSHTIVGFDPASAKFDHGVIYKHFGADRLSQDIMYYSTTANDNRRIDKMIVKDLTDKLYQELEIPTHLQSFPTTTIKENNMSERQLRTPESPIEAKDLLVAGRVLERQAIEELLDVVALVQDLEANQRLLMAGKLKAQDVGNHVQIVDGDGGVMSDFRSEEDTRSGKIHAVLGGRMVDLGRYEIVVITALAN